MTEHTPEKVAELITEAQKFITPYFDYAENDLIRRLADALEAVTAERDTYQQDSYTGQAMHAGWQEHAEKAEAQRDEALAVIADIAALHFEHENTIHATPATVCAHRYCVNDIGDQMAWPCPTGRILSRITDKEQAK